MNLFNYFFNRSVKKTEQKNINTTSDFSNFSLITQYLYDKSGITDLDTRGLITHKLKILAEDSDIHTTDSFLHKIKNDPAFFQKVLNLIAVNETYFFREIRELEWLVRYIKDSTSPLKLLSLPCSSGEEIYTILLMLSEADVDLSKVDIQGYDISSDAIKHAKEGLYNKHALHKISTEMQHKYFVQYSDDLYSISQSLKTHADFAQKNIFDLLGEKEKYDIILSRNMFIYFDDEKRLLATNIIIDLLKTGGIFIKGHADHIKQHHHLKNLEFGIYQKI